MIRLFSNTLTRYRKRGAKASRRNVVRGNRRQALRAETLESRLVMAAAITIDYSFDSQNFFADADARAAIEDVAAILSNHLEDTLDPIIPSGQNTYTQIFENPSTGQQEEVVDSPIAANEFVIYVGARPLGDGELGEGGFGGFTSFGSAAFNQTVAQRGQAGVANNTDFARWGGTVVFDSVGTDWYFGKSTSGLGSNQDDFRSVAYHEILHSLGFGLSNSWFANVSNGQFTGANAIAEFDGNGNIPLDPLSNFEHFADGTTDGGQEVAVDPTLTEGTRKLPTPLDWAALEDVGWEVFNPVFFENDNLIVNGTGDDNVIRVNDVDGDLEIIIDGRSFGTWPAPSTSIIVNAGDGNDEIRFQTEVTTPAVLNGGSGNDRIFSGSGIDEIFGGPGDDELFGRDGDDSLFGEEGFDRIFGMNGNDFLFGGDGDDLLSGGDGDDELNGDAGEDFLTGSTGMDTLRGGDDDDSLNGGVDDDTLFGDSGNDAIRGNDGNDTIFGGAGDDSIFGGVGDDTVNGEDGEDVLQGNAGNDVLFGGDGADEINGGSGNDEIEGGLGDDTVEGASGDDMIFGEEGNDTLNGGAGIDFIYGGVGDDDINGSAGNDQIFGEAGADNIIGGSGDDFIKGGVGNDVVNASSGNDEVRGGDGNDTINGGGGNDELFGEDGDDDLFGSIDDDTLTGGAGLDLLHGGSGTDTATDSGERGEISIEL